jgi:hypothetical protein
MTELPFNIRRMFVFVGIFVLVLVLFEFNSRREELSRLEEQREEVRTMATQAIQTQLALQTQAAYADSTLAVDEWARTEGHYVKEGDQPVVPVGQPGSAPVVMNTPTPIPVPMENWEVWLNLFFDE